MTRNKKKVFVLAAGIFLFVVLLAGVYVWWNIGMLESDGERAGKYANRPYYSISDDIFVSPDELVFFPEQTTGGSAGFGRFFKRSPNAPVNELPVKSLVKKDFPSVPSDYALYWLGHSSVILELDGIRIIIDPVLENAAPVSGVVQRYVNSPIKRSELPDLDIVLITHDHYDHLEMETMRALRNKKVQFICPLGVGARLEGWGIPPHRITEVGWGDTVKVASVQVVSTTGIHYSGRSKADRDKTLWTGYVIKGIQKNVYWSGDTGYGAHFKQIGEQYGPFDLACVEIDGWNAGWPNTHLFPEEVIAVCKDVKAERLLPVHWGVFDLALHPWNESIEKVAALAAADSIVLLTPMMGERVVPEETYTRTWWRY